MRRLNYKLAAGLIVGGAVVGAGVHVLHGYQLKRSAGTLLQFAAKAEKSGDVTSALQNLAEYLAFEPDDVDARARYGMLLEQVARTPDDHLAALAAMETTLRRDPERREVRRKAVDVAMEIKRFDDARAHLLILLGRKTPQPEKGASAPTPEDGELELLVGRCFEAARDYAPARAWYEQAIRTDPTLVEAYVACADLLRDRLDQPDAADRLMDAKTVDDGLIAHNPVSVRAFVERGDYRRRLGLPGVEADVKKALELDPEDVTARLLAASWAIDPSNPARSFEAARTHLGVARAKSPDDPRIYQMLSLVETRAGQPDAAAGILREGIEQVREGMDRLQMRWSLVDLLTQQRKTEDARAEIVRLRDEKVTPELARFLDAKTLMVDGRLLDASRELEAVRPTLLKDPALGTELEILLARCYERLGLGDQSAEAYRRAVEQAPRSTDARLGLAARLAQEGRLDEAILECRKADLADPAVQLQLARLLVAQNNALPPAGQDWREVDRLLDQAAQALPDSVEVPIVRAQSLIVRSKIDEARALIVKARDRQPGEVQLWTALAGLESRRTLGAGLAVLDEAERALEDRVELRIARVELIARSDALDRVETLKSIEDEAATLKDEGDQVRLLRSLSAAYRQAGDHAGTVRTLERIAQARPDDLATRVTLFEEAYAVGDREAMRQALERLEALEQSLKLIGGLYGNFARARYLLSARPATGADGTPKPLDRPTLNEARALLAKVVEARPRSGGGWLWLANVDDQLGRIDEALAGYERAIDLGASSPELVRRTAELLRSRNRMAEADAVLQNFAKADPTFGGLADLRRLAADVARRAGDTTRALELERASYAPDSQDAEDHLRHADYLWAADKKPEAGAALRRAVEVGPAEPRVWVVWVSYLVATGDKAGAEAAVAQARDKIAPDRLPLTLARCYQQLGRLDEARAELSRALTDDPDDPETLGLAVDLELSAGRTPEAVQLLKRRLEGLGDDPEEAARIRGVLAQLMAASGSYQEALRARELLGMSRDDQPIRIDEAEPVEQLRTKANVLALQGGHRARLDAIRVLEQIVARHAATPNEQYLLAQLLANESASDPNAWPRYREQMESLLASDSKNATYLAHYIRNLLAHDQAPAAASWLTRLKTAAPADFPTVELEARVLKAQGQADRATALLQGFAQSNPARLGAVALLLEQLGQLEPAEQAYRQVVKASKAPEAVFVLAGFFARHDRVSEALDLCDPAWATCPPEVVSSACVQILFVSSSFDDAQIKRVLGRVEKAAAKAPDRLEFQFDLANLLIFQRKLPEAEAILRKLHAKRPEISGPLNNLAWLLAVQKAKPEEAARLIDDAIQIDGPVADLLDTRAMVHLAANQPEAAIQDLHDAIAVGPGPDKYFHLAQAYQAAGRVDDARDAFREAIDKGLKAEGVHPLERPGYQELLKQAKDG